MKIEVDKLDREAFDKLQRYLDSEFNRYSDGVSDRPGKVYISGIDREPVDEFGMYEGIHLDVADGGLTGKQLTGLTDIVYQSKPDSILDYPIRELGLSVRSLNRLHWRPQVKSIRELVELTEKDLLRIRDLGPVSVNEMKRKLAEYGLKLADEGDRIREFRQSESTKM